MKHVYQFIMIFNFCFELKIKWTNDRRTDLATAILLAVSSGVAQLPVLPFPPVSGIFCLVSKFIIFIKTKKKSKRRHQR